MGGGVVVVVGVVFAGVAEAHGGHRVWAWWWLRWLVVVGRRTEDTGSGPGGGCGGWWWLGGARRTPGPGLVAVCGCWWSCLWWLVMRLWW